MEHRVTEIAGGTRQLRRNRHVDIGAAIRAGAAAGLQCGCQSSWQPRWQSSWQPGYQRWARCGADIRTGHRGMRGQRQRRDAERRPHGVQVRIQRRLVAGDTDVVGIDQPQVQPTGERRGEDLRRPGRHEREHGVEEVVVDDLDATGTKSGGKADRVVVHPLGNRGQAVGTVIDGVHRRQYRRQHLCRTDVAGRLLPANVLLTGLDGEPIGTMAVGVH